METRTPAAGEWYYEEMNLSWEREPDPPAPDAEVVDALSGAGAAQAVVADQTPEPEAEAGRGGDSGRLVPLDPYYAPPELAEEEGARRASPVFVAPIVAAMPVPEDTRPAWKRAWGKFKNSLAWEVAATIIAILAINAIFNPQVFGG